jgi:hypothetical protein
MEDGDVDDVEVPMVLRVDVSDHVATSPSGRYGENDLEHYGRKHSDDTRAHRFGELLNHVTPDELIEELGTPDDDPPSRPGPAAA